MTENIDEGHAVQRGQGWDLDAGAAAPHCLWGTHSDTPAEAPEPHVEHCAFTCTHTPVIKFNL